ncbi:DUF2507 domain-containing protein [Bacillus horti]|uniref:DUF2507 domain-containing protein n=1 Tax=Caldalkalibacillus horti TaxID=77523 RepID=A0ABT9VTR1_9BACI|nr:DUF2507 domain-containing protein [Bacillus horti]MDQ0164369.1 hypothetical protein [Bacillus horti]
MKEGNMLQHEAFHKPLLQMKGQSVPLLGYHLVRDHVLATITGEHQSSILYWAGKTLAEQFEFQSFEEIRNFFLDAGWGYLEVKQDKAAVKHFLLDSPQFQYRTLPVIESTFALECGFLSQALGKLEDKETEGDYRLQSKEQKDTVHFTVYFHDSPSEYKGNDSNMNESNNPQVGEKSSKEKSKQK